MVALRMGVYRDARLSQLHHRWRHQAATAADLGTLIIAVLLLQGVQFLPQIASVPGLSEDFGWIILGAATIVFHLVPPSGCAQGTTAALPGLDSPLRVTGLTPLPPASTCSMILKVDHLEKHYGGVRAVDGVSFTVERGSITGLIGPNGAGKSTVLAVIGGYVAPSGGTDPFRWRRHHRASHARPRPVGLVRTFQMAQVFGNSRRWENLLVAAQDSAGSARQGSWSAGGAPGGSGAGAHHRPRRRCWRRLRWPSKAE